ncbi:hypothetical protein CO115_03525 [Candidatus Falkowbacteria bacterium CG_4_9_14_3_um_filter_36_9]|uniref:Uncharacterized protein n=2 Tax=Candidatus Falkowiibacteriota TaxID=1752728 RepID=A0A1J4T811_9BACT|nr:MAG: hypothetical protein AUJ27_03215 [Candidatus Falkowbacteria bacterium CG1_02_37_44]PIV50498.1 MAG: hypothetical protein COS18_04925 [Candidatus Falkowbacteria bacterium CG02_land_8_20_14_3_00_36_14]PIX10862.1 MAG: hypothetical protein COZ73_04370 [Candidatus Falkowbacteria bacterium CG_4_8_14_3_um_filter_36_11]PJA10131.1 MAG: hypothetical protein COX67_05365 [Candidatus Falkowbacteria bacterium CG_4_10_14_0_2_um_filter_36_22]PJB18905.1 MAG: hypothetical protein CO115_03525 [Candidatus F
MPPPIIFSRLAAPPPAVQGIVYQDPAPALLARSNLRAAAGAEAIKIFPTQLRQRYRPRPVKVRAVPPASFKAALMIYTASRVKLLNKLLSMNQRVFMNIINGLILTAIIRLYMIN